MPLSPVKLFAGGAAFLTATTWILQRVGNTREQAVEAQHQRSQSEPPVQALVAQLAAQAAAVVADQGRQEESAPPVAASAPLAALPRPASAPALGQADRAELIPLQRLLAEFRDVPSDLIVRVLERHEGDALNALEELSDWSPQERKQRIQDEAGRRYFSVRIPLAQLRADGTGAYYSDVFKRDGDDWRLRLVPANEVGDVELYLELVSENRPPDYAIDRCISLRVLHPTNATLNRDSSSDQPNTFTVGSAIGTNRLLTNDQVDEYAHNGHVTIKALVWSPPVPRPVDPVDFDRLELAFPDTPRTVLLNVLGRQHGIVDRAFAELLQWSVQELTMPTHDQDGHRINAFRLPFGLLIHGSRVLYTPEFDSAGHLWRLRIIPAARSRSGFPIVHLELVSRDVPHGFLVRRCFALCVLHPGNAAHNQCYPPIKADSPPRPFTRYDSWGTDLFGLDARSLAHFAHREWVALQVVVWEPPTELPHAPFLQRHTPHALAQLLNDEEEEEAAAAPGPPTCSICFVAPLSCLLFCCNQLAACDRCIRRVLDSPDQYQRRCPYCFHAPLTEAMVRFGVRGRF